MLAAKDCGILWDVDGTLVDTAELHFQAWATLVPPLGRAFTRADFAATFGRRNPEILQFLFGDRFNEAEIAELGEQKGELYRAAARHGVDLLPGVRALLDDLRRAGFKQAVGSSAPRKNVDLILRLTKTESLFDAVVSMEDTQRGKPDPQVFLVGAARVGVLAAHCVVIEDAVAGVAAARAAGMKCIAVRFVGHHSEESLRAAGADLVVKNLEEVSAARILRILQQ